MYDNFISTLMDMDASAKDFSEDFSQYLMKAVLTAKVGTLLSDQLEGWYAAFDEAMKDGVLTETETEKLREWWDEIVKSGLEMRDTIAQATGVENISSQSATSEDFKLCRKIPEVSLMDVSRTFKEKLPTSEDML